MVLKITGLILVLVFSLSIFLSKRVNYKWAHKEKMASFSAGLIISYLFLKLFPELFYFNTNKAGITYLLVLFGFALIHLIEKYIYQHEEKSKINKDHQKVHFVFSFPYYFILGILINFFATINLLSAALFTLSMTFYTTIETLPSSKKNSINAPLFLAPPLGFLSSAILGFSQFLFAALLSIITGSMFYLVIRELIPKGKKGRPLYFILGILFYFLLNLILEYLNLRFIKTP